MAFRKGMVCDKICCICGIRFGGGPNAKLCPECRRRDAENKKGCTPLRLAKIAAVKRKYACGVPKGTVEEFVDGIMRGWPLPSGVERK